jgi:hypothetical protein
MTMRPLIVVAALAVTICAGTAHAVLFTPGNLAVYRVTNSANAVGAAIFIDEYSPAGALVQSFAIPTTTSGGTNRMVAQGSAAAEGLLNRSTDGRYLFFTGYDAAVGAAAPASAASTAVPRVVGRMNNAGNLTTTVLSDFSTGASPRSAISTNGTDMWLTGGAGGVRYSTVGSTSSTQISSTITNLRHIDIFGGQLYITTQSGTAVRIGTVGSGTPTTPGQTITALPGTATNAGGPYGFVFADLSPTVSGVDTLYLTDDGNNGGTTAGITKYTLTGGTWSASGTVGANADDYRGIAARVVGTTVTLFATGPGKLATLVDSTGYGGTLSGSPLTIATAPTGNAFRGLDFVPVAIPEVSSVGMLSLVAGLAGLFTFFRRNAQS